LYLTRGRPKGHVTLVVPWLDKKEEQAKVYGDTSFESLEDQENWIRKYSAERVGCEKEAENMQIRFYPALYHDLFGSIFATVDICSIIPQAEADIAILEEPEHLTWFRSLPSELEQKKDKEEEEKALIGWTAKFQYVVGILHTNYTAYMKQYGLGASLVTASALHGLSSLVVKAYTHRLIRLSDTLPVLDKPKEVTCNVHGVRSEFFDPPRPREEPADNDDDDDGIAKPFEPQPIYFIGKVIWAKGFDKLLEIEDIYKKEVGDYFPVDIYGSGPDAATIKRAFFGRNGLSSLSKKFSSGSLKDEGTTSPREGSKSPPPSFEDQTASMLFRRDGSLRVQIEEGAAIPEDSLIVEVQTCETPTNTGPGTPSSATTVPMQHPQGVMKHLGEQTRTTGGHVSKAISTLSEKLTNLGLRVAFSEQESRGSDDSGEEPAKYFFDPPRSRFELRRYAIPARFLGTKDHALLRDIPEHKIFINLSITEVLCTTTAEALAMGKFVILPKHRKCIFAFCVVAVMMDINLTIGFYTYIFLLFLNLS
jgi:glycosyltransferase involved in cell wall biosynthesis